MEQPEAEEGNIPLYADKLLFAEDFVNYMMNAIFEIPYNANSADHYREFIYNAFNETVRQAVIDLHSQVEMSMFRFLFGPDEFDTWDGSTYSHIATEIHKSRFTEGFEAKDFLLYCIELTLLAKKFRDKGLALAPDLAVYLIFVCLQEYNMLLGGWDSLNFIAANYVNVFNDRRRIPTPDSFASEISDEALRNMMNAISHSSSSGSDNTASRNAGADDIPPQKDKDETDASVANLEDSPVVNEDTYDEYLEFLYDEDEEEDLEYDDDQMPVEDDRSSDVVENDKCGEVYVISSEQIHAEAKMQVDDSDASSGSYEEGNALLSYMSKEDNYLDPDGTPQTKGNGESSGVGAKQESKVHTVSLKNTLTMSKESENFPVNLRSPFASVKNKPLQSSFKFKRVVQDNKNSTTTVRELCFKNAFSTDEELNFKTCGSTKESNVQPSRTFENFGVSRTADRNCKSLTSEDGSKASTSHQSPWSFPSTSSSSSFLPSSPLAEKAPNSSNGLEMCQTDSEAVNNPQNPRGLKRFPIRDYESSHEKKPKLS